MRFRIRLTLIFGGVLVISLATVLFTIERIAKSTALDQIKINLSSTVITLDKLHRQRVINQQQNLQLLAGDYGFKSAYASRDEPTVHSALQNHQNRLLDADLMALCDLDGIVLSNTYHPGLNGQPFPWIDILDYADESDSGEATAFGILDNTVYQFIVTPLLAPDIEAWIISGFRLDETTAGRYSDVTGSEISFFHDSGPQLTLIASTLDTGVQASLIPQLKKDDIHAGLREFRTNPETYIGQYLKLNHHDQPQITALVQQSLDQALAPYRKLSTYVMWIFIASICGAMLLIVVLSKNVTRSLRNLSRGAQSISQGDLTTCVEVPGTDEFAQLAGTFNEMARGLSEKEQVRDLLGKVVSPAIASKLMSGGVELGGEERHVSVLFCDIRGFTRLSETQSPTRVLNALNTFFSGVGTIIESHGGVVDKYIGDAVMALFGAPMDDQQHAANAVACGMEICAAAESLLPALQFEGAERCDFGVGIHSGTAVAGNVGSSTRLNYTVIGDTVNVASRVEGQTRVFHTPLLVTEATASLCSDVPFKKLGSVQLKGRSKKIALFSVE